MNPERIGQMIKDIRKKNHLTQKQFADKYGVTYQAVSKWENGKNIPDIVLLREIGKDFEIPMEDLLDGKTSTTPKKSFVKKYKWYILGIVVVFLLGIFGYFYSHHQDEFEFKTISANCNQFKLSGSIAYNEKKSSIYISHIEYCGEEDTTMYQYLECNLYEVNQNTETKIQEYVKKDTSMTLEEFLKDITFKIDNYEQQCKIYKNENLYLQINATDMNGKTTTYKVPLSLDHC